MDCWIIDCHVGCHDLNSCLIKYSKVSGVADHCAFDFNANLKFQNKLMNYASGGVAGGALLCYMPGSAAGKAKSAIQHSHKCI